MLRTENAAAIRLAGYVYLDDPGAAAKWVTIEVAGGAIRWTRSDGAPWSAELLEELAQGYWDAWRATGPAASEP
ncbi:MAG: hypothetical protein M3Y87_13930 [Myxococcota bacterium]|nr:hypothetical protein [Myxococcota bacterium]